MIPKYMEWKFSFQCGICGEVQKILWQDHNLPAVKNSKIP